MKSINYHNMECAGEVMSNFDHLVNNDIAEKLLKENTYAEYPAWDFWSVVWYENEKYYAMIKRYHCHIDTLEADTLKELMDECCDKYGYQ